MAPPAAVFNTLSQGGVYDVEAAAGWHDSWVGGV